jgi:hypothetical protein
VRPQHKGNGPAKYPLSPKPGQSLYFVDEEGVAVRYRGPFPFADMNVWRVRKMPVNREQMRAFAPAFVPDELNDETGLPELFDKPRHIRDSHSGNLVLIQITERVVSQVQVRIGQSQTPRWFHVGILPFLIRAG